MSLLAMGIMILFITTSAQLHLPPNLLASLCYVESKHNTEALHKGDGKTDSLGLCQVKLETAKWLGFKGTKEQLMEPSTNIYYAGLYLKRNITRYNGSISRAVIAYNQGSAKNLTKSTYQTKVFKQWRLYALSNGNAHRGECNYL